MGNKYISVAGRLACNTIVRLFGVAKEKAVVETTVKDKRIAKLMGKDYVPFLPHILCYTMVEEFKEVSVMGEIKMFRVDCELTNWKQRFVNGEGEIKLFPAAMYSEQIYYESNGEYHICLSRMTRRKKMHFCILSSESNKDKPLDDFIKLSGLEIKDVSLREIENYEGYRMLKHAQSRGYGINENIVFNRFGLEHIFPKKNSRERTIE